MFASRHFSNLLQQYSFCRPVWCIVGDGTLEVSKKIGLQTDLFFQSEPWVSMILKRHPYYSTTLPYMSFRDIVSGIVILFIISTPPYSDTTWSQVSFFKNGVTPTPCSKFTFASRLSYQLLDVAIEICEKAYRWFIDIWSFHHTTLYPGVSLEAYVQDRETIWR